MAPDQVSESFPVLSKFIIKMLSLSLAESSKPHGNYVGKCPEAEEIPEVVPITRGKTTTPSNTNCGEETSRELPRFCTNDGSHMLLSFAAIVLSCDASPSVLKQGWCTEFTPEKDLLPLHVVYLE